MNASIPAIPQPLPDQVQGWLVLTPEGGRQLVLDHARAVDAAAWRHGIVYPLVVPAALCFPGATAPESRS